MKKKLFKYSLTRISINTEKSYKTKYGSYSIKSKTQGLISIVHLENIRRKLSKQFKKNSTTHKFKIFIRCPIWKPYTAKPLLSRMGKGAGNISYWLTWIKIGFIFMEISTTLSHLVVNNIVKRAAKLFPIKLLLIKK